MNIPSLVIGLAAGLFLGILACILYRTKKAKDDKEKIANAEEEALRIINDAIKSAESKKREATLEAKEEILRSRKEYEKEEKERRADLQKQELIESNTILFSDNLPAVFRLQAVFSVWVDTWRQNTKTLALGMIMLFEITDLLIG